MSEEEEAAAPGGAGLPAPGGEAAAPGAAGVPMPFLLVLVFFAMGLLGFVVCRALKKKGYRCRTLREPLGAAGRDEALREPRDASEEDEELNEDTMDKIVKCIIQNEANVEVLKGMLAEGDAEPVPVPVPGLGGPSSLCLHRRSQDGGLPHHHTVHLGSKQAPCIHCSQKKRHSLHRQGRSKEGKSKMHPGETTVFSVGRFHVTHIGKKPASHDSKGESLPDSKQDLGSGDLDHEAWEGSQSEAAPVDRLHLGRFQEAAGAQRDGELKDACDDEPTQGESLLNAAAELDVAKNGLERRKHPNTGSLQRVDLLSAATSDPREQKFLCPAELLVSEDLDEMERLAKKAHPSEDEGVLRATNGVSGNESSQVLQGGSSLDLSGKKFHRIQSTEQQEQSLTAQDPGVCV